MKDRLGRIVGLALMALASPLAIATVLAIYEVVTPADRSLIVALSGRWGSGEAALADAAREAEALLQFRLTQAEEENRRITAAYTRLYDAMGAATQRASDLEGEIVRIQARNLDETQWTRKLGANLTDLGCLASGLAPESGLEAACDISENLRQGIVREFQETLPQTRPRFVEDVLRSFPKPSDMLASEFERAREEFLPSGNEDDAEDGQ